MRSAAIRHPGHVSSKTLTLVSVAICLALLATIVALIAVRSRDAHVPIARETQEERELLMGWTELGAVAASDAKSAPLAPLATTPNQSLPPIEISMSVAETAPPTAPAGPAAPAVLPAPSPATTPAPTVNPPNSAGPAAPASPVSRVEEPCGSAVCTDGKVCCNASCGTCAEPGQKCSQAVCGMSPLLESVPCGPNTCNTGQVCCNASCGTCTQPGQSCDTKECDDAIQYPASQSCGLMTCNVGNVCCNPSCGICAPPGEACSQRVCG